MHIRTTTDPMTLHDVSDMAEPPCIYQGDGDDGLEIYFESEQSRQQYLDMFMDDDDRIVLRGNDSADYIAEG